MKTNEKSIEKFIRLENVHFRVLMNCGNYSRLSRAESLKRGEENFTVMQE